MWASSGSVRGRGQMAAAPGKVLFQPGVGCQLTPPPFRGTAVTSRLNRVISQQSTNEPDNSPRFSLGFSEPGRKREGACEALVKWHLARHPHPVTALPLWLQDTNSFNVIFNTGDSNYTFYFHPGKARQMSTAHISARICAVTPSHY